MNSSLGAPHVEKAWAYAAGVRDRKILACQYTIQACERFLRDFDEYDGKDRPYYFDSAAAEKVCKFLEGFKHIKGEFARGGDRLVLEPWQCLHLVSVFGFKHSDTGFRKYRRAYLECARKQGKTAITAGVGLYMLAADGEPGSMVYSAATTREQAKLAFNDARAMAEREPAFRKLYGVRCYVHAITQERTNSGFTVVSAESENLDGLNPHAGLIDELHAHRNRRIYDVIETAQGSRAQSLLWTITTAGSNQSGICYELRGYLLRVLAGALEDDAFWGIVYTLDPQDDWQDESVWPKANPNLGVSLYVDELRALAKKAAELPASQANFLTKRMNVWVNADEVWLDVRKWIVLGDDSLEIEQFAGERCFIGVDLAFKSDFTAIIIWFPQCERYPHTVFAKFFLPEVKIHSGENDKYPLWEKSGHITAHAGEIVDMFDVAEYLDSLGKTYDVAEIAVDPWQVATLASACSKLSINVPIVETRQLVAVLSPAMKELEAIVLTGQIRHDGNPVLSWMLSNVIAHRDEKDNIHPIKAHLANKIDGPIALFLAGDRVLRSYASVRAYDTRGLHVVPKVEESAVPPTAETTPEEREPELIAARGFPVGMWFPGVDDDE